ncbi:plasmid replication initiator protein [Acuticoccus sediminis]|uniref:Plasmid replication initiator protein n=1 Tax=Acuticoccus sediminis TaxID=2184697 RepID=A0A8B2NLA1_9HYPH|nr:replication initiator protein A [Acuticoccus sediminis]RAH95798.1 plasmid replication initiator protein [Acuticoccus sediminis]
MQGRRLIDEQFDLFILSLTELKLRDARETMERPFFSLGKRKRLRPIEYESDSVWVKVEPHQNYGMATIWDADVLIWAASVLMDMKNRGVNDIPNELHFQPYDLLKAIHRSTGGDHYLRLRDALSRLRSTTIRTNIRAPRGKRYAEFSWISEWTDLVDETTGESRGMSIVLSQWFVQGVLQKGGVLAIDPAYFGITGGRERWLYRVARKHAGGAGVGGFAISLPTLFEKSGSEGPYRRFKYEMQKIVQRNELPGVTLAWEEETKGEPRIWMGMRSDESLTMVEDNKPRPRREPRRASEGSAPLLAHAELGEETITKIRKDFPGWDVYAMKGEFDKWITQDESRRPSDYQSAFYGFMRQHHAREGR